MLAQQQHLLSRSSFSAEEKQAKVDAQKRIHEAVLTGKGLDQLPPDIRRAVDTAEFRSLLEADPAKLMKDVRQPILIVQGALDTQVEPPNADRLEALARKRKNAPPVEVVKVPGVNHLLVPATTGEVDEYGTLTDKRVSQTVTQALVTWLQKTLRSVTARLQALESPAPTSVRAAIGLSGRQRRSTSCVPLLAARCPHDPIDPTDVIDALARAAEPGLVTTTGPRYFGFVTGGALPATVAAEWLTAVWDQPAGLYVMSPAASVVEEVAGAWLLDLLGLPAGASVGFVTGCHMANFTALAAARHELLRRAGWDVEADGLQGAPRLRVIVGDEVHVSVIGALRMLGLGSRHVVRATADDQGRMQPESLDAALRAGEGPDDRLRAGRQREHRRVRSARRDRRRLRAGTTRGCTSTARSGCGRPPARRSGTTCAASSAPTRGPPTRTNGSTCRTTRGWCSSPIPPRTGRR